VLGAVATFLLLGLRERTSTDATGDGSEHSLLVFFLAGAVAICAMILPGVSGSFLLVLMGMYASVLGAVTDRDLAVLGVFVLGCVVGLGLFSQLLHWALEKHYDSVMAVLVGLMIGSIRVLWPWPDGVDSTALGSPEGPVLVPVLLAVGAFVVVIGFDLIARRFEHRSTADEAADLHAA
jgi:putative membrane protein